MMKYLILFALFIMTACNSFDKSKAVDEELFAAKMINNSLMALTNQDSSIKPEIKLDEIKVKHSKITYKNLSELINFQVDFTRFNSSQIVDSCVIKMRLIDKNTNKPMQTILLTSTFFIDENAFMNNENSRSYSTGYNKNKAVVDWDYGDIIVADFNFDNKDDFAVKKEVGGNGGPHYQYYIQKADTSFILDNYLTNNLNCFPNSFDYDKKTLKTICRGCTVTDVVTIIKLDTIKNKWKLVSSKEIDTR